MIGYNRDGRNRLSVRSEKAGQTNSAVRLGVVNATGGATRWMKVPGDPRNIYIPRMNWSGARDAAAFRKSPFGSIVGMSDKLCERPVFYPQTRNAPKLSYIMRRQDAAAGQGDPAISVS